MSKGIRKSIVLTAAFFLLIVGVQSKDKPKPKEETGPFFAAVELQDGLQKGHVQAGHNKLKALGDKLLDQHGNYLLVKSPQPIRPRTLRFAYPEAKAIIALPLDSSFQKKARSLDPVFLDWDLLVRRMLKNEVKTDISGSDSVRLTAKKKPADNGRILKDLESQVKNLQKEIIRVEKDLASSKTDAKTTEALKKMRKSLIYRLMAINRRIAELEKENQTEPQASEKSDPEHLAGTDMLRPTSSARFRSASGPIHVLGTGSISGTVTDTAANGISGVQVSVYDLESYWITSATTDAAGAYTISGLDTGNYKLEFYTLYASGNYAPEWYNDKPTFDTANTVAVTDGSPTTGINAQLTTGGIITGTVTDESGNPIENVYVEADETAGWFYNYAVTNSSGVYQVQGLAMGNHKVSFYADATTGNYISEWYNDKADYDSADAVAVTAGSVMSGINAQLAAGGAITGTVTNGSGTGIANVDVSIYDSSGDYVSYGYTNSSGVYEAKGLPTGSYKVYFGPYYASGNYLSEWYNDKADFDSAGAVSVTAGSTTSGINAQLATGGAITGTVTNSSGTGIEDVEVDIYDSSGDNVSYGYTNSSGVYEAKSLPTGSYKVYFDTYYASGNYLSEWYNDQADFDSAGAVSVTAGSTASGINAQLAPAGTITGTVTNGSGTGIEDVEVDIYDSSGHDVSYGYTNSSGVYEAKGLPTGSYKVSFYAGDTSGNYISEWYNDKADFDSADAVAVTAGSVMSGINAQLAAGGAITGTVTNGSGTGIENVEVDIYDSSGHYVSYGYTNSSGVYEAKSLPTGTYKVKFYTRWTPGNYLSEWYNNKADIDSADAVSVTAGSTTSGINAQLAAGGAITGTVTNGSGTGIENVRVRVYDLSNNSLTYDYSDSAGAYELKSLPTGSYKVYFDANNASGSYFSEWYNDQADFDSASAVSVTAGSTTSGINAQLAPAGTITGTVTNGSGTGIADVEVDIYDSSGDYVSYGYTNSSGVYEAKSLLTGSYKVYFDTYYASGNYISEWYNDKADLDSANAVSVTAGSTTSGINAQLATGGAITGTVTNGSGTGIADVDVYIYDSSEDNVSYGYTNSSGVYEAKGLPTGSYKLRFSAGSASGNYLPEWYNDKPDFDSADAVSVTAGSTTSGINAQLAEIGTVNAQIVLSKSALYFGGTVGGAKTMDQELRIQNGGTGTMAWEFSGLPSWLTITPSSGSGNTALSAAVNTTGLAKGTYPGLVTVSSPNAVNSPQTLAVTLKVYAAGASAAPFGSFDTPVNGSTVRGSISVTGWALDDIEVTKVEVRRDPVTGDPPGAIGADGLVWVGDGTFVEGARPDVEAAQPSYPLNTRAGWGYMLLTYGLPDKGNGTFVLHAVASDKDGHTTELGTKTIVSDNANNTKPFGAIDTPGQGGTTSGNPYVNFGWVLTPPPAMVPIDGSTIWLWIDGVQVGHPTYNQFRADVHDAYPDYLNADGAVGFYYIDTTAYANGMHTIGWSATDDHSQAEGMGSRFFWVFNGSSGAGAAALDTWNGSLADLAGIPADVLSPIYLRTGFRDAGPHQVANPDAHGIRSVTIDQTDRVVMALDSPEKLPDEGHYLPAMRSSNRDSVELTGAVRWSGYLVVGNELRPLPIGSTLDARRGVFFWQPGPGFIGEYRFVFVDGRDGKKKIMTVNIRPKSFPQRS